MLSYDQAVTYLYESAPLFQQLGPGAYKEGLENTLALDAHFGHPHRSFRTIHIAGTNGKGTCSHTLASILQEAGYKVGLYTSPHLLDFRERIRVNGKMIPKKRVIDFVVNERDFFEPLHPSFFELTTALAFKYFEEAKVDVAVVEVGLGGRLDCTNIISPAFCIITNISLDHTSLLGHTLAEIATEKAGIIKSGVPVVIGETTDETRPVFLRKAQVEQAPIIFAEGTPAFAEYRFNDHFGIDYDTLDYGTISSEMGGYCQTANTNTLLHAMPVLQAHFPQVSISSIQQGFAHVLANTHLMGRWQKLSDRPAVVCDTGHNPGAFFHISHQLKALKASSLRVVLGMAADKDVTTVLKLLPTDASYYFCQASVARALPAEQLQHQAASAGLQGESYTSVSDAFKAAKTDAAPSDFIYVGGSTFVVADFLSVFFHN